MLKIFDNGWFKSPKFQRQGAITMPLIITMKLFPLAVQLGTITSDLERADVFSYPEDESVTGPNLAEHLAFLVLIFPRCQKTEMTTTENELDQNTNFDCIRIQECGKEVEPLFGNGCYVVATMQVIFSTHSFCSRYYMNQNLKSAFAIAPADPTVGLNMQLTKLANGFLSSKYSVPAVKKQEGIRPIMFKAVIAVSHPEFSTMRQQDALEFFLHLIDQVERINSYKPGIGPHKEFQVWCRRTTAVPLWEEEHEDFHILKAHKETKGKEMSSDEIVRPRVPLSDCLNSFSHPEEVHGFFSTTLNARITAINSWGQEESTKLLPNEDIVFHLALMGFNHLHCQKATINTSNVGVEEVMNWLLSHMDDPDIDALIQKEAINNEVDPSKVATQVSFGFEEEIARKALKFLGGDIEKAIDWIFNPPASSGPAVDLLWMPH